MAMSGRGEDSGGNSMRSWFRGALVVVVIVGALGAFGARAQLRRPELGAVQLIGIAVMLVSLAVVILASRLAGRFPEERRERAGSVIKLLGVTLCAVGAMLVFI